MHSRERNDADRGSRVRAVAHAFGAIPEAAKAASTALSAVLDPRDSESPPQARRPRKAAAAGSSAARAIRGRPRRCFVPKNSHLLMADRMDGLR